MPAITAFVNGTLTDGTDMTIQLGLFVEGSAETLGANAVVPIDSTPAQVNAAIREAVIAAAEAAEFVIDPSDPKTLFAGAVAL
jgi:hypothetical protein